jgi:hypothetical protein
VAKNNNLHKAKTAKNDKFYTQLTDIEKEEKYFNISVDRIRQAEMDKIKKEGK